MASKLIIDRIPPDMHVAEDGNIVWTPRLIDYNAAAYSRGHVVTSDEFNTELLKQTYQGNYNTDTISVLIGLYNTLKTDVNNTTNTANTNAANALAKATQAESNSEEALNTANSALTISTEALSDVQAAVNTSVAAVEEAERATILSEESMAVAEDAAERADEAKLEAYDAMRIAEGADNLAVNVEKIAIEAKQIAVAANASAVSASTKANTAETTANSAKAIAEESAATVAGKASTDYVDNALKDYYNKSTVDKLLSEVEVDLSAYYTGTKVDTLDAQTLASAKSYTDTKVAALIDSAPETLDTFKEIADAFAEDQEVLDTLNAAIGLKANQASLDEINTKVTALEINKANKTEIPTEYIKDASVTDDVLTIEKQDGSSFQFEGGSKVIVEVWK